MAKFTNQILIIFGLLISFHFFGLNDSGATGGLLGLLLHPTNIKNAISAGGNGFFSLVGTLIGSLIGAGVIAIITRSYNPEIILLGALISPLLEFGWELFQIYNIVAELSTVFAVLVLSPMLLLWVFTVIEWWRGVST